MSKSTTANGLPRAAAATLACLWEATAPKPGNVYPGADFDDLTYADFVASAVAIGPIIEQAPIAGVGRTVLDAVRATQQAVGTNTNLGTLLLIAPLAAVPDDVPLASGITAVLDRLTPEDTRHVYHAIRLSGAGGMGRVGQADVFSDPPPELTLIAAMRLAAERDLVARQYVSSFADVLTGLAAWVEEGLDSDWLLRTAIVHAHVRQLAAAGDSLILRKCGPAISQQCRDRAASVLAAGHPGHDAYRKALCELDAWLRADGHRRNPGTTADLVAAALFVLLREGRINWIHVNW